MTNPAKIHKTEVTLEMVQAGLDALALYECEEDFPLVCREIMVEEIYRAMNVYANRPE